ncbi:hypothetical protein B0H16DRAFT_1792696 [Mycena metata]|uniref:CCHC-type domain-containing protein n=1 Tax=Mycena metata TaxID=1033252 RepID=A0AAD7MKK6_9AGAR|nr:hypothetical protein B0H16DRAFT_1792696 [Mycena metata]
MASKKIPEAYEKNAPRFDDEKPEELNEFLENMERMMEIAATDAKDKNAFVVRYAMRGPAEEWKRFDSYGESYEKFKKEILANYPNAKESEKGSMRKLLKRLKDFDEEDIDITDPDELMRLARVMNLEASKLLVSRQLSDREAIPLFFAKLTPRFQEKILDNLESDRRARPAARANAPAADEDKTLTLKEVLDEAKRLVQQRERDLDFFQRKISHRDMSPGPSTVRIKKEPTEREARDVLDQIKLSVVNMMDKMESLQTQKLSEMDQNQKKKLEELEQFYKSLPGRVPGAPDSQTRPPRQEFRQRPVANADICHYCKESGGHWMSDCPYRRAHITSGALRVVDGKDYTRDGATVQMFGPKSRKQQVDEFISKGSSTAQVKFQSAFVQHHPAASGYGLSVDEQMAIETDNGDGYGYFDPSENPGYDPRDDEIRTLRVEQANMMRQLVQHQQQLQRPQAQQPQRDVQPPVSQLPPIDVNLLSSLLAAALRPSGTQAPPTETQLAQTRANPSRTGNGQAGEGF